MVTDDPDTPGNGRWEINLASAGDRTSEGWRFTGFDADINYGLGERLQLKIDAPWDFRRQDGTWSSGLGKANFGIKWRFLDDDSYNWTVSTYPQFGFNLDSAAVWRRLSDPGHSALLPVEASSHLGPIDIDVELGRELHTSGDGNWIAGVLLAHTYSGGLQVMAEAREHWSTNSSALLINVGGRWQLRGGTGIMAALGREVGADNTSRLSTLVYVGVQIRR